MFTLIGIIVVLGVGYFAYSHQSEVEDWVHSESLVLESHFNVSEWVEARFKATEKTLAGLSLESSDSAPQNGPNVVTPAAVA